MQIPDIVERMIIDPKEGYRYNGVCVGKNREVQDAITDCKKRYYQNERGRDRQCGEQLAARRGRRGRLYPPGGGSGAGAGMCTAGRL